MNTTRATRALGREGYTMMELLTVLVVIGVLVQIAAPKLSGSLRYLRTKEAATQVAGDLAQARLLGIRSGRGATVRFTSPTGYSVLEGRGAAATPLKSVSLAENFRSVRLVHIPSGDSVGFDSRGMARGGAGTLVLYTVADSAASVEVLHVTSIGTVRRED